MRARVLAIITFVLGILCCVSVSAANTVDCTVKIDNVVVAEPKAGEVTIEAKINLDNAVDNAAIFGVVYSETGMEDAAVYHKNLSQGENSITIERLTATDNTIAMKVIIFNTSGGRLRPVAEAVGICDVLSVDKFEIDISGVTYSGIIDNIDNTIDISIPSKYNNDGTYRNMESAAYCPVSPEAVTSALGSITPNVVCANGTTLKSSVNNMSLADGGSFTVQNSKGAEKTYNIIVSQTVLQRDADLKASNVELTNPSSDYGYGDLSRHGAPTVGGVKKGSGVWQQTGFAWKTESEGRYVLSDGSIYDVNVNKNKISSSGPDDEGGFVKDDAASSGYFRIINGSGLRMVKDNTGEFSLYSSGGGGPNALIDKVYSKAEFTIEQLSGTGMEIAFSNNRFVARITPDGSLYFGKGNNSEFTGTDTGIDLALNTSYELQCIHTNDSESAASAKLILDGVVVARKTGETFTKGNNMNPYHISIELISDERCSVVLQEVYSAFVKAPVPEEILAMYEAVMAEEREIWKWTATMYDGGGSIYYDPAVDTENLKYDSMNYITGGTGNGFFYAPSSEANPTKFAAEIESTGQVLSGMGGVGLLKFMPPNIRDRFYQFFASKYADASNYTDFGISSAKFNELGAGYYDRLYMNTVNARGHSRNQGNAGQIKRVDSKAVTTYKTSTEPVWGIKASVTDPMVTAALLSLEAEDYGISLASDEVLELSAGWTDLTAMGQANATNMVAAIKAGTDAFRNWIEHLNWCGHSWTAGDILANTPKYIDTIVPENERAAYYNVALKYLLENQNTDGTWWKPNAAGTNDKYFGTEVSGIFKVCNFLTSVPTVYLETDPDWTAAGLDSENWMPKAQVVYDYVLYNIKNYDTISQKGGNHRMTNTLQMRNALDVVHYIRNMVDYITLVKDLPLIISDGYEFMNKFEIPGKPGEYVSSVEYDSDGNIIRWYSSGSTAMGNQQSMGEDEACINTARNVTKLYEYFNSFYGLGRPTFDKIFAEEIFRTMQDKIDAYVINDDFDGYSVDATALNNFAGPTAGSAKIEEMTQMDGHKGKVLSFTYGGTESSGPNIKFKTSASAPVKAVMQFDMKFASGFSNTNLMHFGLSGEALFSVVRDSSSTYHLVNRSSGSVDTTKRFGDIMNADTWYKIRIEYTYGAASNKIALYVNDTVVYQGNDTYSGADGSFDNAEITMYKGTNATVYIDNMSVKTEN